MAIRGKEMGMDGGITWASFMVIYCVVRYQLEDRAISPVTVGHIRSSKKSGFLAHTYVSIGYRLQIIAFHFWVILLFYNLVPHKLSILKVKEVVIHQQPHFLLL